MRKAFTLIEVMVVLSILAIIAILGYNLFGSTMREARLSSATTEVYKILTSVDNAWTDLERQGVDTITTTCEELINNNILREIPDITRIYGHLPGSDYFLCRKEVWNSGGPTAAFDDIVYGWFFNDDFCKEFNRRYTSLGATIPTIASNADAVFYQNPMGLCAYNGTHPVGSNTVRLIHRWK